MLCFFNLYEKPHVEIMTYMFFVTHRSGTFRVCPSSIAFFTIYGSDMLDVYVLVGNTRKSVRTKLDHRKSSCLAWNSRQMKHFCKIVLLISGFYHFTPLSTLRSCIYPEELFHYKIGPIVCNSLFFNAIV